MAKCNIANFIPSTNYERNTNLRMWKAVKYLKLLIVPMVFNSCSESGSSMPPFIYENGKEVIIKHTIKSDTTIVLNHDSVDILFPSGEVKGTILVLPGWNYSRKKCCKESSFCSKALSEGYALVLPEMGKSIYASTVYSETRKDWLKFPQLKWVTDTLFSYISEKAGLLKNGGTNFIFGISTGGRGVALILEHTSNLFKAGAALSGDYDQRLDTTDNLMKGVYGTYSKFKQRWEGEDNALINANKIKVPLYLGHGADDKIVPFVQTKQFCKKLSETNSSIKHVLHISENHGHDYTFWDSETDAVLRFFGEVN